MRGRQLLVRSVALGCFLLACGAASAQVGTPAMTVSHATGFAVSQPLSQARPALPTIPTVLTAIPLRSRPLPGGAALAPNLPDSVLQTTPGAPLDDDENRKVRFSGVGANGSAPGDPNIAVGPNHIVQIVNTQYAVYDKSGKPFPGYPKTLGSIFTALGGSCTGEWSDPIAQYDKTADRWLLSQQGTFNTPGIECIAVSQSNDPTSGYFLYSFIPNTSNFNDYPKIGVWPTATNSAYLATYNLFDSSGFFVGADLCAYDRAAMLAGAANATQVCFLISNDGGFLPSDLDGSTAPPAGAPGYFLNFETLSSLRLYSVSLNFAGSSTLSSPTNVAVASFNEACGGGTCIPQPGTSNQLDSLADRLMYRLAYRNFGDHDALVVNHSVTAGASVGVRWYELRSNAANGAFSLYQQGTFAPDSTYRWMGSTAMDQAGDIAIGYSASSSSVPPGLRYTGRNPTDALGTMRTETIMLNGTGSQTGGLTRWGDYSALRIDPSDDCTFWYTNQYLPNDGSFNWATWIGSFKFTNCGATTPDFSLSASPSSQSVTQGNGTSYTATVTPSGGFTGSVTLSASGLPAGANVSFSPNPMSSGTSTMSVTTSSTTPTGTYTLTITGTSGSLTHSTNVTLVVNAVVPPDFSLSVSPTSRGVSPGNSTTYTATVTPSGGFTGSVTLSASGLPAGANVSFSPNPMSSGTSTMSVTTSSTTPTGTYTLTLTGVSGSITHTTSATFQVTAPASGLRFIPVTPCRVADTRNPAGPFGAPFIAGNTNRPFTIPSSSCGIPATAQAYSLNVTVVPHGSLSYLTVWPTGQTQPLVSTLNSVDGRIKANAAIVPAGTGGAVSVFATNDTEAILDINGYFVLAATSSALAFYPMAPCRLVDTRSNLVSSGALSGGVSRTLPLLSSSCNVPATAQAYSLNFTVVPGGPVGYLSVWPTGLSQPLVSTLNDNTGTIVANAAIVPAGTAGSIDVYATNTTDLVVDINGYFGPAATGGLSLYNLPPCRVLDTRNPPGSPPFTGSLDVNVIGAGCGGTSGVQAYVLNATVVPSGALGYLTLWPQGAAQPTVSTLNAVDGAITSNMAIVPTDNTEISGYASGPSATHLILDMSGYFAP